MGTERVVTGEPRRDQWGRYLMVNPLTGEQQAWTRATTVAKVLEDQYGIGKWRERMVAKGVAIRDDLRMLARALDPEKDKGELQKVAYQAADAAGSSHGRNVGTGLHAFSAQVDRGEQPDVPYPWDADLRNYRETLQAHGVVVIPGLVEVICCLPELGIAGTFDRIVTFALERYVDDVKTGSSVDYPHEWSIQLALYAHAPYMTFDLGKTWEAMPRVNQERALVTHLPEGRADCRLYWVDIAAGWDALQLAVDVREWRNRKGLLWPIGVDMLAQPALQIVPEGPQRANGADTAQPSGAPQSERPADGSAPGSEVSEGAASRDADVPEASPSEVTEGGEPT